MTRVLYRTNEIKKSRFERTYRCVSGGFRSVTRVFRAITWDPRKFQGVFVGIHGRFGGFSAGIGVITGAFSGVVEDLSCVIESPRRFKGILGGY